VLSLLGDNTNSYRSDNFSHDLDMEIDDTILDDIASLFDNREYSDLTLLVESNTIYVNRAILAVRCPYFKQVLYSKFPEEIPKRVIKIRDEKFDVFYLFIKFLYTGKISKDVDIKKLVDLMMYGEKYEVPRLKDFCCNLIMNSLTIDNASSFLLYANSIQAHTFKDICMRFIAQNYKEVLQTDDFKNLVKDPELLLEVTMMSKELL
jgi:hypothetical protein